MQFFKIFMLVSKFLIPFETQRATALGWT